MVYDNKKLVAVLPANRVGEQLYSHQGLTYGGLVYQSVLKGEKAEEILVSILSFMKHEGIRTFFLKQMPPFYPSMGNAEIDFFLFKRGAVLYRKEMNLGINFSLPFNISNSKLKHYRKIEKLNLKVVEEGDFTHFWQVILEPRLWSKHKAKPVHTLEEINKLKKRFPANIKQYSVILENEILAGITIFKSDTVVKSQYGATTAKGEQMRAMDFLFIMLIKKYQKEGVAFFDMGIVGENNDKGYNSGLLQQKEELGCTIYSQDFYKLDLL
jgi:hypothetical protein